MRILLLLITTLSIANVHAQRYGVSFEAGASFGTLKNSETDSKFGSEQSFSLGQGQTQKLMFQYMPDSSNWYFCAGLEGFQGTQVTTAFLRKDSFRYQANYRSLNSLRLQTQLAYKFNLNFLDIDLRAGVVLPITSNNREEQYMSDSNHYNRTIMSIKNYTSLGFVGGVNVNKEIAKNVRFFINTELMVLNTKVKSASVSEYKDDQNGSLESAYPNVSDREYIYHKDPTLVRNNASVLPALFKKDLATDKLTYTQAISSISIKVGFLIVF